MYHEALAEARAFFNLLGDQDIVEALKEDHDAADYGAIMLTAAHILADRAKRTYIPALRIARMYAHARCKDRALEWLERACEQHELPLIHLGVVWDWDILRDEPRFQAILRHINFPHRLA